MGWPDSKITKLLGISLPIIQAPMAGGATTPELVAAVSNAGGLGSLGVGYMTADEIRSVIKKTRALTHQPFAINLFIPEKHHATNQQIEQARKAVQLSCPELNFNVDAIKPPYTSSFEEQMNIVIEEKIPVFSFTFGIPSRDWIERLKKNNTVLIGTSTSLEEAKLLEEEGVDAIVAQGCEAGGHRGTFLGKAEDSLIDLTTLIPLLVEQGRVPIIAAGGIMDAKRIMDVLKLGASVVQMGTAFLCCPESGIHPQYKKLLLNSSGDHTTLTRAFSGKLARGIQNTFIDRMQSHSNDILDYPIQNALTSQMRKEASKQDNINFMSLWAGQSAYLCKAIPAAQLIKEIIEGTIFMQKTIVQLPEKKLIGITTRTNNKQIFESDPSINKIAATVQKYFHSGLAEKIDNRKTPGTTFCVYTNYESDANGDYTYFIGEEVTSFDKIEGDFESLIIPAQQYAKFTNQPGSMPAVCIDMWKNIWKMNVTELGGKRAYISDFEIYDERSANHTNVTLDIFIGIK